MRVFAWFLVVGGVLLIPIVSLAYLRLRLPARTAQLVRLFTLDAVLPSYLRSRGRLPAGLAAAGDGMAAYRQVFADLLAEDLARAHLAVTLLSQLSGKS